MNKLSNSLYIYIYCSSKRGCFPSVLYSLTEYITMTIEVEVVSRETIKRSSPTPDHLRNYQLSFLDQVSPQFYMPWVLFYPKDTNSNLNNLEQIERIKKSLSEALTHFYPLAGRIKDNFYIECNDEGVHYVEAVAKCNLSKFLENPNPGEHNKFLPYELDNIKDVLAAVQVTSFNCGGIVIGLELYHVIGDASSFFLFINNWAAVARGGSIIVSPQFDVAAKLFPPVTISGFNQNMGMIKEKLVIKRFVFDTSAIAAIRDKYTSSNTEIEYPRPTRVEALSAFIHGRFIAATQPEKDPSKLYLVFQTVNMRTRLDPPLPENCFGNISQSTVFVVPNETEDDGFSSIVLPMRDSIKKVDLDYVKKLLESDGHLNFMAEVTEKANKGEVVAFAFTSLCRFPIYEVDFGWGKPIWGGSTKMLYPNLVTFFDTKSGDGIEAWINLMEEDMAKFEEDKEVMEYVSLVKNSLL